MIALALAASLAFANDEKTLHPSYRAAYSHVETHCEGFDLHLGDDSKDVDSEVAEFGYTYLWATPGPGEIVTPKQYNEILFLKPTEASVCKDTQAYKQDDGLIAIFFRQNNRPFEDKLGVSFYDPSKKLAVASDRELGVASRVEKAAHGYAIKIHDTPTDVAGPFTVTVHGHKQTTSEEILAYYKFVTLKDGKIEVALDKDTTYSRSNYKPYFKSQAEFEKAFGEDYANHWIYKVEKPDCIAVSHERVAKGPWFCRKR